MTRQLRVLMVTIDLHGGAGQFCRNLAVGLKGFHPTEFSVSLLMFRQSESVNVDRHEFHTVHTLGVNVHAGRRRLFEPVLHVARLRHTIARIAPDVILTAGTYANLLVPLAARFTPTVLTAHSNTTQLLAQSRYGGVVRRLIRWRYPRHPVICPSDGLADDLRRRFGVRNPIVIPHGVDRDHIRALARELVTDVPASAGYVVACGRLTAAKDYPNLLAAYAHARRRGLPDPLVIVGGGEDDAALRSLATQFGVASDVHFLGHRDNPYPYLKQAKLLVLSSAWEGFGLVLVEAMMLGLPVLSTDCPSGPGEILGGGEFGPLVPPGDPIALGDALADLAASDERLAHFARQSERRSHHYLLEGMATRYRDLFSAVLGKHL